MPPLKSPEAEDYNDPLDSGSEQDKDKQKDNRDGQINESKLTANEVQQLKHGQTSIKKLVTEREQLKRTAEVELNAFAKQEQVIDLKEYKDFKEEIEETESPEKMKEIIDRIRDIPRKKEDDEKERDLDDPEILKLDKQFEKICKDNDHLISDRSEYEEWWQKEKEKHPNTKHLKDILERFEGKRSTDKNGLAPRREEYNKLGALYKKYGLSNPLESPAIKKRPQKEREAFRKSIESLEDHFDKVKDTGFYSKEMINNSVKGLLKTAKTDEVKRTHEQADKIERKESEGFTYLDSTMMIGGTTIRKMSQTSKKKYLDYYKTTNLKERSELVVNWKDLVENEAKLAKDLEKIYKDFPEGLKAAIGSFEELDFLAKQEALKEHENLIKKEGAKEETEKILIQKAAHAKIDGAASSKVIAKSTQKKYKEWFDKEENFKDSKTGKKGDLKTMKKYYAILTSATPDGKARNLKAYEIKRDRFKKEVEELENINPDIDPKELNKWQEDYDKESWTNRKAVYKKLVNEQEKQKADRQRQLKLEKEAGMDKQDKQEAKEAKEASPKRAETIRSAIELINNDQAAEALKVLLAYNETDPDDKDIIFWMEVAMKRIKEFGSGKKVEDTVEKELEEELKEIARSDEPIRSKLEEEQVETIAIEGAEQMEQRHQRKSSAHERARDESMDKVQDGSLAAELTEDAYNQMGETYILNEETTGEQLEEIDLGDGEYTKEQRQKLKSTIYQDQSNVDTKEGINISLTSDGRNILSTEAKAIQADDLEELEQSMAEKAEDRVSARRTAESPGGTVLDLNARIAAKRKAKEIIEEKRHEKLRAA